MVNKHHLYPVLVRKYGEEDLLLLEKTLPWAFPAGIRLAAILCNKFFWGDSSLEIALDITEPQRCSMYIDQYLSRKWTSIQLFYLPEDKVELCRVRHDP